MIEKQPEYDYEKALKRQYILGERSGFCFGVAVTVFVYMIGQWLEWWT